ncbi:Clp protease ClpP [Peptoniphilus equinus]|uniref:ATP-dependent Clp protease proteolytic subunit n=1 Tax=Peptoniphilus equinus TaxID=3016343 RepID=A0ABY7QVG2_9FIRM|nr:head maturation protease, ClpP-related [Peptoniphilus equinus]WBW50778.1 Clp protease ClpP [Peptoniphilus equinus]
MLNKKVFWNWASNENVLYIDGVIAEDSWFDDDVTPKLFASELKSKNGDITLWLNSPGGDCIAASRIYTMLLEHEGKVTVKVDGLAASAASVIAMAGSEVLMSPTSLMMIHNPLTVAIGDSKEMQKAIDMLKEVKESIINAYELKTGLSRDEISNLMDGETWFDKNKAMDMGFCDGTLTDKRSLDIATNMVFSRRAVTNSLLTKINKEVKTHSLSEVEERLNKIKNTWR